MFESRRYNENNAGVPVVKSDVVLIAQVLQFLVAGFETSATTLANLLNCLALNEEIQDKLRAEIRGALKKHVKDLILIFH